MFKFFKFASIIKKPLFQRRSLHIDSMPFSISDNNKGIVSRISWDPKDKHLNNKTIREKLLKSVLQPNSLSIWTEPSATYPLPDDPTNIVLRPGHIMASLVDSSNQLVSQVSKRPDNDLKPITYRLTAPDSRFKKQYSIPVMPSKWVGIEEELDAWIEKKRTYSKNALYVHMLPITPDRALDYRSRVNSMKNRTDETFVLRSTQGAYCLRQARNCIDATAEAILDSHDDNSIIANMFCQQAGMVIVKKFLQLGERHLDLYQNTASNLGYTDGIEVDTLSNPDDYKVLFTM